jgi:hypothetical protein
MARTKRPRADSDAAEEKSNAKRYNGGALDHEEGEGSPKDRSSQDHSKQTKNAEQRDADLKVLVWQRTGSTTMSMMMQQQLLPTAMLD